MWGRKGKTRLRRSWGIVGIAVVFIILFSVAFFWSCNSQQKYNLFGPAPDLASVDNGSLTSADDLLLRLEGDAGRMTLVEMQKKGDLAEQPVELPEKLFNPLFNGLVRVFRTQHPSRDSVMLLYQIHTFPVLKVYNFALILDTTEVWVKEWGKGRRLTGNPEVDRLMIKYGLTICSFHVDQLWGRTVADLKALRPLNPNALVREFVKIRGVNQGVVHNGAIGDGDDIAVRITGKYWEFDFSHGWGDCPAGCIERHYWTFRVHYNGTVEYMGSRGDPVSTARSYGYYDDGC